MITSPSTPQAYIASKLDQLHILTLLTPDLSARNAHWVKNEVITYLDANKPEAVVINLRNIKEISHIGLGALIAINNRIRPIKPHAFVGIQPEAEALIQRSNLGQVFLIWTQEDPCLLCYEMNCVHKSGLQKRINENSAKDHPIDESRIPHLGAKPGEYVPPQPLNLADDQPLPVKTSTRVGLVVISLLLLVGVIAGTWFAALKYAQDQASRVQPLSPDEVLEKYDKNGDGYLTDSDIQLMNENEKLTFSPWCVKLKLNCGHAAQP